MRRLEIIIQNLINVIQIAWEEDKWLLLGYFLTSLFGAALLFASFFAFRLLVDQVTINLGRSPPAILIIIIITYLFFEYLSRFVYSTVNQYYFDYIERSKLQNALTRIFMTKLADLDFAHLENGEIRNLIARVESTFTWRLPENLRTMNGMVYSIFGLILAFFISLTFNPLYFLLLAAVTAPLYYLRAKYSRAAFSIYSSNAPLTNYLWYLRNLFINFQTLSEMKLYQLKDYFIKRTADIQNSLITEYQKPIVRYTLFATLTSLLIPIVIFFTILNFLNLTVTGRIFTIGQFTFFLNTLFAFSSQIASILFNLGAFYENSLFVEDYFKLLSIRNLVTVPARPYLFKKIEPREIRFVNISFAYPGSKHLVLKNINFTIKKTEDIAIVGHNGAGKTTLIKLFLRFYDPTQGVILIDGVDLRQIDLNHWYQHLGILFQDFARYNLTLRENIEFGDIFKKKSQKALLAATTQAQAEDVVKSLPNGFDQILGRWFEGGQELSIGQWQKVAIARALYRSAPFLILDEPTSNIDAESEYEIFSNLKTAYKEKSLIFISHRFSTVRMADKILVLENGQIIEEGNHLELLKKQGLYARYFQIQKKGYE